MLNRLENLKKEAELSKKNLDKRNFALQTIYDVSRDLGVLTGTREIMENLLMMVIGNFGALSGVMLLVKTDNEKIEAIVHRGMEEADLDILSEAIESGYFNELQKVTGVQLLFGSDDSHQESEKNLFNLLSSFKISIWIPFSVNDNFYGGIGLGIRLSGAPYTEDDQHLLRALANHGALAIRNAKFLEQAKKDEMVRVNLARYLSPQIVDQVIKEDVKLNLGGNRKVVSVLFSDIRDFTKISENHPPDQLILILNEYFTEMARIIFENKGSLDKYIGDAIVAVFGSLIPLEDHQQNAVQAAIQMMKHLPELNERWKKKYNLTMGVGIGINRGEVFLGNVGSPERMEFTVIGDTINVASRFSGLARNGQILVTKSVKESLDSSIECVTLPPSEIKGKAKRIEVFKIIYS